MLLASSQVVLAVVAPLLTLFCWRVLSNCVLSPLRSIPGPFLAKLTGQWLIFIDLAGNRTATIDSLHKQYGAAVRIGPNEVSFSSQETVKEIYGQQTQFIKAPVYEEMVIPPFGIFSLRDPKAHHQRRRLLNQAFSQAALNDTEPSIHLLIEKLNKRLSNNFGNPSDMLALFRSLTLDLVGELFLGQPFGALDQVETLPYLTDVDETFLVLGIKSSFPYVHYVLTKLPIQAVQHFITSIDRVMEYGRVAFYRYIEKNGRISTRRDLLTKILAEKPEVGMRKMTDLETYTEVSNLIFAAVDTTSTTLTYLFWELAKNQSWQDRLREELKTKAALSSDTYSKYSSLVNLPILDAIVDESLRLHPAAPASLQRSTPSGGRVLASHFIPEGTVVSMQNYTTHRDPSVFPSPETWDPNRWLHGEPNNEVKELFMPFSRGPRACLGKAMALMELKLVTAAIVRDMKVSLAPGTTDESMAMKDHFLAQPVSKKCDLIFHKV